ncbi:MAG: ATP-binding cassette domain-containing protein [Austwickia sp.]|nr:ATP-binding cassette domain-containing protein [Austwickia sp.]
MIDVQHLSKHYGAVRAVDDVTFTVPPGRVVGFLGPNGAGKSTAMRCLAGLSPATGGTATVLGRRYADLPNPGLQVGVLLDASAQHAGRTGTEVLALGAAMLGVGAARARQMQRLVGLTDAEAKRRVGAYSLGMRQRLGIAHALLGDPKVLILDEPVNGLDPGGIRWMRDLLRQFADQGGAVLLSSHLLSEIEQVADDLLVIGNGRIVAQGAKHELLGGRGTAVRVADPADRPRLEQALASAGSPPRDGGDGALVVDADPATVGRLALQAGVALAELRSAQAGTLEDVFLQLTADTSREGRAA